MSDEKFSGVETLLERMNTHPEEFFESGEKRGRWSFMYKDYFKDSMTESEKGRLHEALRKVRRLEFDALVVKELMKEEVVQEAESETSAFGQAPMKVPGGPIYANKQLMQGKRK